MMRCQYLLLASALLATAYAAKFLEFSEAINVPNGWRQQERADPNRNIRLSIALKLNNPELLEETFWAVSDPENPRYGDFLSVEDVSQLVGPSGANRKKVLDWISKYQISDVEVPAMGDWIHFTLSVSAAEEMLATEFYFYDHPSSSITIVRSPGPYHVHDDVADLIDFVGGVVRFPKVQKLRVNKKRQFSEGYSPVNIKQAFGIPADIEGQSSKNRQGVAQFDVYSQYLSTSDLNQFQETYNLPQQNPVVNGYNDESNPGIEAMLDIEYIMGMAPNVTTWFVTTNGTADGGQEPFLQWITDVKNDANSPWVHSVSYGDDESTVSYAYASRINQEAQIFGTMGRTILFSSGDDGAGCSASGDAFAPNFPATSPYVTAVGGVSSGGTSGSSWQADSISSGGFSNFFARPSYQKAAVTAYLSQSNLPVNYFNASGRGFPDIASFSENINIVVGGVLQGVAGTSCASPVIAGTISLINDQRLLAGKPTLGFLNVLLYNLLATSPNAFFDVTTGQNEACNFQNGFNAAAGWDPVTGVGVPNFPNLLKYAMNVAK